MFKIGGVRDKEKERGRGGVGGGTEEWEWRCGERGRGGKGMGETGMIAEFIEAIHLSRYGNRIKMFLHDGRNDGGSVPITQV